MLNFKDEKSIWSRTELKEIKSLKPIEDRIKRFW
jgi:hypothetical protein